MDKQGVVEEVQQIEYEEQYPKPIRRRIDALKNLQQQHRDIERKFHEELLAIERKYIELYSPLYQKRHEILTGQYEPTNEECKVESPKDDKYPKIVQISSDADKKEENTNDGHESEKSSEDVVGIPAFWLTCLKNHPGFERNIMPKDEEVLRALENIKLSYLEDQYGFKFEFHFKENPYFTDKVLTKTYFLSLPSGSSQEDYSFDKSEGCEIHWKENKNLTVRIETKKQRHKGTNRTRVIKRQVPQESFFTFFSPPTMPDQTDTMPLEEIQERRENLDSDFDLGEDLRTKIVPNAVGWFTGEAAADFLLEDELPEDEDYYDEDSEEDDGED